MGIDDFSMAGAADDAKPPVTPSSPDNAREVFPVKFDKDYMDFRMQTGEEIEGAPKGWSARGSVTTSGSPTGLEDVSKEDLESSAILSVVRDNPKTSSEQSDSGKQTSSEATSTGKNEQPAKT